MSESDRRGSGRARVNLWPRRIITGLGLLIVAVVLVWGIIRLVGVVADMRDGTEAPAGESGAGQSDQSSGAAGDDEQSGPGLANDRTDGSGGLSSVVIEDCSPDDLEAQVTVDDPTPVGDGTTAAVTLTGASPQDCTVPAGALGLRIVSGDQTVFDSSVCDEAEAVNPELLLYRGEPWSGSVTWDGRVHDGCTPIDSDGDGSANVATAGTYRAQLLLDGAPLGDQAVFTVAE